MSCFMKVDERADLLLAHASGRLDPVAVAQLETHTRSCADCAAIIRTQAAISNALNAWQPPPVSSDFDKRLFARLDAAEAAPWFDRMAGAIVEWFRPVFARPAIPLAAAAILLAGGFVMDHPSKTLVHVSSSEVEQVQRTLDDLEMLHQFDAAPAEQSKTNNSM